MSICVLCNRTFGSDAALKQHKENSPKHAHLNCKACNRSFSSQNALGQHQNDSPVHKDSRRDSVTTAVTPVPVIQHASLPSSTSPNVPSTIRNGQRSRHTTTENISRANPAFDSRFTPLEESLQALTISDVNPTIAQPETAHAHVSAPQGETRASFTFPELHDRVSQAVAPEITSTWFNPNTGARFDNEWDTNIIGKFTCDNIKCRKKEWSSMVVAIWIKGYHVNGYNATVYNQRCNFCNRLGSLKLDEETYVQRVAYWVKQWAGVRVKRPSTGTGTSRGPHDSERCEGCRAGHCPRADDLE